MVEQHRGCSLPPQRFQGVAVADIEYDITIISMTAYPEYAGKSDVVFKVVWALNGTDGEYSARHISQTDVAYHADEPFTEYDLLRPSLVTEWIYDTVGPEYMDMVRGYVAKQISDQVTPTVETKPLPWDI